MIVSQIVAVAENGAIGKDNDLIWRLPADLKYFKAKTSGHHIITGRKNYESIGRPLPNRTTIIITRNKDYVAEGCIVVSSIKEAIEVASSNGDTEAFIMGGGEIYRQSMDFCDRIYLTEVKDSFEADTFYEKPDKTIWKETSRENHSADEKNPLNYSFVVLERH